MSGRCRAMEAIASSDPPMNGAYAVEKRRILFDFSAIYGSILPQMKRDDNQITVPREIAKKHIVFVVTQSELGGAQRFLAELIGHLDQDAYSSALVTGRDGAQEIKDLVPPQASFRVAKLLRRNPNPFFDVLAIFQLLRIFRKENPDIIFKQLITQFIRDGDKARLIEQLN